MRSEPVVTRPGHVSEPVRRAADYAEAVNNLMRACMAASRVELLMHLVIAPMDVSTMADVLDLELSYISHALGGLRRHGLVVRVRADKRFVYGVTERVWLESAQAGSRLMISSGHGVTIALAPDPELMRFLKDHHRHTPRVDLAAMRHEELSRVSVRRWRTAGAGRAQMKA